MHLLCLGNSFTGRYLALNFPAIQVSFLSRNATRLKQQKLRAANLTQDQYCAVLDTVPAVMVDEQIALPYISELKLLQSCQSLQYIHISSTSVLGRTESRANHLKDLPRLNESSPPEPDTPGGHLRYNLEQSIQRKWPEAMILRAAGIYGPGRNIRLSIENGDQRGKRIAHKVVNRIHVHDLCRLVISLVNMSKSDQNVPVLVHAVDEKPALNQEVFQWLSTEYGLVVNEMESGSDFVCGKFVMSKYTSPLLGKFRFPDYKSGLEHHL